jgi:cytochrome P450
MQSFSFLQMARMGAAAAWGALRYPKFPDFRPHDASFYPRHVCYSVYPRMRYENKVFYMPKQLGWSIAGDYETFVKLLRDDRLSLRFADWRFYPRAAEYKKTALDKLTDNLLMSKHRADHQRLRRLAVTAFSPRIVDQLMPQIRATVARNFDALEAQNPDGIIDFTVLAKAVPLEVLTQYLGVPSDYQKDFYAVSEAILGQFNPSADFNEAAALQGIDMLKKMVAEKRAHPQDDLVSALATTAEDGDKLSEDEMLALIASVLAAGPDSVRDHITTVAHSFAQFPAVWQEVRAQPELLPQASLEAFRWSHWGHRGFTRFTLEDLTVHGVTIPKGEMVRLVHPVFLLDESVFAQPLEFNIHRANLDKLLHFGTGPHYCLGANIAKAIIDVVVAEMLQRYDSLSVAAEPSFESNIVSRRITHLPLRVHKTPLGTAQLAA